MSEKRDLLAIGHTAFDYIIQVGNFPALNSSTAIRKMKNLPGGAAANVAVVGSKLGLDTCLVSAVGGDFASSHYNKILNKLGIFTEEMIVVEDDITPTAFVLTDSNNDQISYFYWGAAKNFKNSNLPLKSIKRVKAVHLATGDPLFNQRCGEESLKQRKLITFDPGQDLHMYSPQELKKVVELCDILFGNHFEIDRIKKTLGMSLKELLNNGPDVLVKTHGSQGSTIYAPHKIEIKAVSSNLKDPTGAGDSYRAGFIRAYLEGNDLEYCGNFASAVASFIIEAEGCQTYIPSYDMVKARME